MVSYKTWLGRVVGQAFREAHKRTWNKYSTEGDGGYIGYATKKLINFPFEALQSMLIKMYNKFYWITADLINQMGCNIGDHAMGQIDNALEKAYAEIKTKVAEAQKYIEDNMIKPLQAKIKELEPYVDDLLDRVKSAETTIAKAKNQIDEALSDVSNLKTNVASLNQNVNNVKAKVDQTISDFQNRMKKLEIRIGDANYSIEQHGLNIKDLYDRVKTLEAKTTEQKDSLEWLRKLIPA